MREPILVSGIFCLHLAVLSRLCLPYFNLSSRPYTGGSLLLNPETDHVTPAVPLTEMILFLLLSNCLLQAQLAFFRLTTLFAFVFDYEEHFKGFLAKETISAWSPKWKYIWPLCGAIKCHSVTEAVWCHLVLGPARPNHWLPPPPGSVVCACFTAAIPGIAHGWGSGFDQVSVQPLHPTSPHPMTGHHRCAKARPPCLHLGDIWRPLRIPVE